MERNWPEIALGIIQAFREEVKRASKQSDPAEQEAIIRLALSKLALEVAPDMAGTLRPIIVGDLEKLQDLELIAQRKGAGGKILGVWDVRLRCVAGFCAAILRSDPHNMKKTAAEKRVARWTEGELTAGAISHWTPKFGDVLNSGRDVEKNMGAFDAMEQFFALSMSDPDLKKRVKRALDS